MDFDYQFIQQFLNIREKVLQHPKVDKYVNLKEVESLHLGDLCLSLIENFPLEQIRNKKTFYKKLFEWNNTHSSNLSEGEFISEKLILCIEDRILINPFIKLNKSENKYYDFLKFYEEDKYNYPIFEKQYVNNILKLHNEKHDLKINLKDFLGEKTTFFDAVFHNSYNLKDFFYEALNIFLMKKDTKEFENEIEDICDLLLEIDRSEIDLYKSLGSLSKYKKCILRECLFKRLDIIFSQKEMFDYEEMVLLRYIPYKFQEGVLEFNNPPKDSNLISLDRFKSYDLTYLSKINTLINTREYGSIGGFKDIFPEYKLLLANYKELECEREFSKKILILPETNYLKNYYFEWLGNKNFSHILKSTNKISPYILKVIHEFSLHNLPNKNIILKFGLDIDKAKVEILKYYFDKIIEINEQEFEILVEFFMSISSYDFMKHKENLYNKKVKELILNKILFFIKKNEILLDEELIWNKSSKEINSLENYKLLLEMDNRFNTNFFIKILDELKIQLNKEYNSLNFDFLKGEEILFECFDKFGEEKLIEFIYNFKFEEKFQTESKYSSEKLDLTGNLIFLLGIFSKFILFSKKEFKKLKEKILDLYLIGRNYTNGEKEILCWEYNFLYLNREFWLKKESFLIYLILKLIDEDEGKRKYIDKLKEKLDYLELFILNMEMRNVFNFNLSKFNENIEKVSPMRADKTAMLLQNYGLYEESIKYIEHSEKSTIRSFMGNLKTLKISAFINTNKFEEAKDVISSLNDWENKNKRLFYEGTFFLAKSDFKKSIEYFEKFFKTKKNDDLNNLELLNYSIALAGENKYLQIISLLENKTEDCLSPELCFYLGIAYSQELENKSKALKCFLKAKENNKSNYSILNIHILNGIEPIIDECIKEIKKENYSDKTIQENLSKFIKSTQIWTRKLIDIEISKEEKIVLKELHSAISSLERNPNLLLDYSENDSSDMIRNIIERPLINKIIIERERPEMFADKGIGEIDFFLYKTINNIHQIVAIGENKQWSPQKFESQISQLLGYMKEENKFGFTIIFNKNTTVDTVRKGREEILEKLSIGIDGKGLFRRVHPIIDVKGIIPELEDCYLTIHENPEVENSEVRLYHFILNAYFPEREKAAKIARPKKNKN